MPRESFSLESKEEVAKFEALLDSYVTARAQFPLKHISLTKAYESLQDRADGGRIFSALLDVHISFLLVNLDMHASGVIWNQSFSKGKLEGGSVLDSTAKFFGKMDIHRAYTSYVLRYRALWDKIMGLIILIYVPAEYETFASAKSKRRTFAKLAEKHHFTDKDSLRNLDELLTNFDNKFRTPEAHGTGTLRKHSFTMTPLHENPQVELIGFWNALNSFILNFGKIFNDDANANPQPRPC